MKKTILILSLFAAANLQAQVYGGAIGIWHHSAAAESYLYSSTNDMPSNRLSQEYRKRSYGSGITAGVFIGSRLAGNLYGELAVGQFFGATYRTTMLDIWMSGNTQSFVSDSWMTASRIMPSLLYTFTKGDEGRRLETYSRFGLIFHAMQRLHAESTETYSSGPVQRITYKTEYSGGFSMGLTAGLGLRRHFGSHWLLGAEAFTTLQHWAPLHAEITEYKEDNVDKLSSLSTYQRETDYSYEVNYPNTIDSSKPREELRFRFPMSSVGVLITASYKF